MPLKVSLAREDQIEAVTDVCLSFQDNTEFVKIDRDYMVKNYKRFTSSGLGGILCLSDDGVLQGGLGFVVAPDIHYPRTLAIETFWYVPKENRGGGIRLLHAFEQLAKDLKCDGVAMIHLSDSYPESLEKLYVHRGYKLVEKHYVKELSP